VAFKYKMTALQAALGRAQLERVEELLERKRQIYGWYAERLRSAAGIALMASEGEKGIVWWMVTIQLDPSLGWDKDQLQSALAHEGIDTRPGFRPLSSLPAYADSPQSSAARSRNATAYAIDRYYLNLPSAMSLTEEDVDRVCTALANALSMPWSSSDADD
jgi:perosamine synthetase